MLQPPRSQQLIYSAKDHHTKSTQNGPSYWLPKLRKSTAIPSRLHADTDFISKTGDLSMIHTKSTRDGSMKTSLPFCKTFMMRADIPTISST